MPPDGFLFSIAGLSASLAGLAGLVAGLRRGAELRFIDAFRLRQIVEFSFGNVLVALLAFPLAGLAGTTAALRIIGLLVIAYIVGSFYVLFRRSVRQGGSAGPEGWNRSQQVIAIGMSGAATLLCLGLVAAPSPELLELVLLVLLARPMAAFLLVLSAMHSE